MCACVFVCVVDYMRVVARVSAFLSMFVRLNDCLFVYVYVCLCTVCLFVRMCVCVCLCACLCDL